MEFGERIREKRKALGLTQAQVGSYFDISSVSVSEWERGISKPEQSRLEALARLLKTSISYLLTGRESQFVEHIQAESTYDRMENAASLTASQNQVSYGRTRASRPPRESRRIHVRFPVKSRPTVPNGVFEKVKRAMPQHEDNFDLLLEIQGFETRYDYISDKLIALFIEVPNRATRDSSMPGGLLFTGGPARLWNLAVTKQDLENMAIDGVRLALLVALDLSAVPLRMATRMQANAQLVGIDLVISNDPEQLTEFILSTEEGRPSKFEEAAAEYDHW